MITATDDPFDVGRLNRQINGLFTRLSPSAAGIVAPFVKLLLNAYSTGGIYLPLSPSEIKQLNPAVPLVGTPDKPAPLIIENNRLYIARLWWAEHKTANHLLKRATISNDIDTEFVLSLLNKHFPHASFYQKKAIALALHQHLLIISGGAGTGKTNLAVDLLVALTEAATLRNQKTALVALIAPTKKAVNRLNVTLGKVRQRYVLSQKTLALLPQQAVTLHQLLGLYPAKEKARYHADNPLFWHTLIIDDAHLISMEQMSQLTDALLTNTRLILLGDPSQLVTKNHPTILTELYHTPHYQPLTVGWLEKITGHTENTTNHGKDQLSDCIMLLEKDSRLAIEPHISELAKSILAGEKDRVLAQLNNPLTQNIINILPPEQLAQEAFEIRHRYFEVAAKGNLNESFASFSRFMPLAITWDDLNRINREQDNRLEKVGIKSKGNPWYSGRPITLNAQHGIKGISVGEIGLTLPTRNGLRVFFPNPDGDTYRHFHPDHLPDCHTTLALHLFKSHALTFDHVGMLLPHNENTELDRYWLSFALARAKQRFSFYGKSSEVLISALSRIPHLDTTLRWRIR